MKKNVRILSLIIFMVVVVNCSEAVQYTWTAQVLNYQNLTGDNSGIIPGNKVDQATSEYLRLNVDSSSNIIKMINPDLASNASCLMANPNLPDDVKGKGNPAIEITNMQVIIAPQGWSGLSTYIIPDYPDVEILFQPYQDQLLILYNKQGVYNPSQQLNTLGNWNPHSGYIAKFNQETTLVLTGEDNQNRTISLSEGWNLIPVLSNYPVNVEELFENYELSIIKEAVGWKLYWPEMSINTLDELVPGNAYYVMMNVPAEITFPDPIIPLWQCGDDLVDNRDGQTYTTVEIDNHCWMAENLNIGTMMPGSTVFSNNGVIEKNCYDDSEANCDIYGGFYQWQEMMQYNNQEGSQGLCMDGWHIPTDGEFTELEDYLGGASVAGGQIKSTGTLEDGTGLWFAPNINANNSSGLTALPGGSRDTYGLFSDMGWASNWWTSTQSSPYSAWRRMIINSSSEIYRYANVKDCGYQVRCIKDFTATTNLPPEIPFDPSPEHGAVNQPIDISLLWDCTDPEGDLLTYDLYFGTEENPPISASGLSEKMYVPEAFEYNIIYYWKIVASDDLNSAESPVWNFTTMMDPEPFECGDPFTDQRDGQEYNTVLIGDQCWMVENLNIGSMIESTAEMTNDDVIEKYCYNNDPANCDIYGGLYQWDEMMFYATTPGTQGICPGGGWYLPTDEDWTTLTTFLGGESIAGNELRESGTSHWASPNAGATNSSGFTARPGGYRNASGYFWELTYNGRWWTSTEWSTSLPWYRMLSYNFPEVYRNTYNKTSGFSVRCIKVN